MSHAGMLGLKATLEDVSLVLQTLDDDDWGRPSAARGWTVKDVVIHMGDLMATLTSAVAGTLTTDLGIEALNEANVAQKRQWPSARVAHEFRAQADAAMSVFESLQSEPAASLEVPFLDLGTYSLHTMPDVCAFDFFVHLRWDIMAPSGPLHRTVPVPDELRMRAAVGWLLQGISQMQPDLPQHLLAPITLMLSGPGGGTWRISHTPEGIAVDPVLAGEQPGSIEIFSSATEFLFWSTTRSSWRNHVDVAGNTAVAHKFLDHLNLT